MWTPDSNFHPDMLHLGSEQSALDILEENRPYIHSYQIDLAHPSVSPVAFGDEGQILEEDDHLTALRKQGLLEPRIEASRTETTMGGKSLLERQVKYMDQFNARMRGVQPGLWEETPANAKEAAETGTIIPYRNRREDIGSISYLMPKASVGGAARYLGVRGREQVVNEQIDEGVAKARSRRVK